LFETVEISLVEVGVKIEGRFEIKFLEIGCNENRVHFFCLRCSHNVSINDGSNNKEYYSKRTFSASTSN